jgi:hypothetical protein
MAQGRNQPIPIAVGLKVCHAAFGAGAITSVSADRMTIDFDEHGERTFLTELALPYLTALMPRRSSMTARKGESKGRKRERSARRYFPLVREDLQFIRAEREPNLTVQVEDQNPWERFFEDHIEGSPDENQS